MVHCCTYTMYFLAVQQHMIALKIVASSGGTIGGLKGTPPRFFRAGTTTGGKKCFSKMASTLQLGFLEEFN